MKKYQAKDPQMTTFVFNDEEITTKLVYGILSQTLSSLLGRVVVKPHPLIRQAVIAECPPEVAGLVQHHLDHIIRDYAITIMEKTFDYIADNELVPKEGRPIPHLERPMTRLIRFEKRHYKILSVA